MIKMSVGDGSKRLAFFIGACVQVRDESGAWPVEVADVKRVVPNSDVTLERLRTVIRLRQNRRGLVLVDKRSGEAVFTVATEGTPEYLVLLGGDGGGEGPSTNNGKNK
jgi:hypothetical protein